MTGKPVPQPKISSCLSRPTGGPPLIGETICGSTGKPLVHKLPNESIFRISTKREIFPDGKQFEGVGITPDHEILRKIVNIQKGNDPVLKKLWRSPLSQ